MDRGDWGAARGLFRRAYGLLPERSDERATLGPDLALSLQEIGENEEALAVATEASNARDPVIRARGVIAQADASGWLAEGDDEDSKAAVEEARSVLEEAGDDLGLAHYWRWYGYTHWANMRAERASEAWQRALAYAISAGANRLQVEFQSYILSALALGPTPVDEALPYAENALEQAVPGSLIQGSALRAVGKLRSCCGELDEGRRMHERGREIYREAGMHVTAAGWAMSHSEVDWRAGDLDEQERVLREAVEVLDGLRDQFFFPTVALRLADCLLLTRPPDDDEVAALCAVARERTLEGDLVNFVYLDGIEARRLAYAGSGDEARELAAKATGTADTTDNFDVRSHAWYARAEALHLLGEHDDAGRAAAESIAIRAAKGDVAGAAALERRYAELGLEVSP